MSWRENANNNVWIFGGQDIDANYNLEIRNYLWKIQACTPIGTLNEITGLDTVCAGDSITLSAFVTGGNTYLWDFPTSWGSQQNGNSITVLPDANGVISVRVIGSCGDTSNLATKAITVESILVPVITQDQQNGVTTLSVPNVYATYQWSKEGTDISGATSDSYVASENGYYTVAVTSSFGCATSSDSFHLTGANSISSLENKAAISLYPNPTKDLAMISIAIPAKVKLVDISGRVLFAQDLLKGQNTMDLSKLSSGMYFIEFRSKEGIYISTLKLIKE